MSEWLWRLGQQGLILKAWSMGSKSWSLILLLTKKMTIKSRLLKCWIVKLWNDPRIICICINTLSPLLLKLLTIINVIIFKWWREVCSCWSLNSNHQLQTSPWIGRLSKLFQAQKKTIFRFQEPSLSKLNLSLVMSHIYMKIKTLISKTFFFIYFLLAQVEMLS